MQVILLEKVANLGKLGDQVKVRAGYGRNFLIPFGKAVPATKANVEAFEKRRAELESAEAERLQQAESRQEQLQDKSFTIVAKAGDEGKLFGSIGTRDIAEEISKSGVEVVKSEVRLPEGALRQTGEYEISIALHSDVEAVVKIVVVSE